MDRLWCTGRLPLVLATFGLMFVGRTVAAQGPTLAAANPTVESQAAEHPTRGHSPTKNATGQDKIAVRGMETISVNNEAELPRLRSALLRSARFPFAGKRQKESLFEKAARLTKSSLDRPNRRAHDGRLSRNLLPPGNPSGAQPRTDAGSEVREPQSDPRTYRFGGAGLSRPGIQFEEDAVDERKEGINQPHPPSVEALQTPPEETSRPELNRPSDVSSPLQDILLDSDVVFDQTTTPGIQFEDFNAAGPVSQREPENNESLRKNSRQQVPVGSEPLISRDAVLMSERAIRFKDPPAMQELIGRPTDPVPLAQSAVTSRDGAQRQPPNQGRLPAALTEGTPPRNSSSMPILRRVPSTATQGPPTLSISQRANDHIRNAFDSGQWGALYHAQAEFIKALRLVARALDQAHETTVHSRALSAGLQALTEADDFTPKGENTDASGQTNVADIVAFHQTPVLRGANLTHLTPATAQQRYYHFAKEQLAVAGDKEAVAAMAIYGLARIEWELVRDDRENLTLGGAKVLALHQAAVLVNPKNYWAANELGVLFARFGQLEKAQLALYRSVTIHPHASTWHNLSVVYERLGEVELAQCAREKSQSLSGKPREDDVKRVYTLMRWRDLADFTKGWMHDKLDPIAASPSRPRSVRTARHREKPANTLSKILSRFNRKRSMDSG